MFFSFFFFNDTATTEIYTLSLHDALPISRARYARVARPPRRPTGHPTHRAAAQLVRGDGLAYGADVVLLALHRSEEHTSELQSRQYLVCRLLLEKKKKRQRMTQM